MTDRRPQTLPSLLIILALAAAGAPTGAGEQQPADPPQAAEPAAASPSNVLQWRTATEVDNFGYNVYRAESEDGPFERLNADPIPGAGTSDEPSSYEYVDDAIDPHTTYWYYLESVSMSGAKETFTPVFRKQAKLTRESGEAAAGKDGDSAADDSDQG